MEYPVFESRAMELLFKSDGKLTPQLAAFRIGCTVDIARRYLDQMTTTEIVVMEVDPNGIIYYDMPGRPSPTNEPLSWSSGGPAASHQGARLQDGFQGTPTYQHGVAPVNIQIQNVAAPASPSPQVIVVAGSMKSAGTAAVLGLFFGPLGMLYSTGVGALVMFFVGLVVIPVTAGLGLLITAPICAIWASRAASAHNQTLRQAFQPVTQAAGQAQLPPPATLLYAYPPR